MGKEEKPAKGTGKNGKTGSGETKRIADYNKRKDDWEEEAKGWAHPM